MTHRERIIEVLEGRLPDVIPCYGETPMDVTVFRSIMPPPSGNWIEDEIRNAEFFGNGSLGIGIGIGQTTLSRDDDSHTYRYDTGAVWRESYKPVFCREAISFPVNEPEDAFGYHMISARDPGIFDDKSAAEAVRTMHDAGYFVQGGTFGAWQGIYYYLTRFENILEWMLSEPEAAHALFGMTAKFSLEAAERLIACGVDAVFAASDFGSGRSLLFSRKLFLEYVFPWLEKLARLCHRSGVYLHLHSHGHIGEIMDDIVRAGVDMLNPVGPSDHNDLAEYKRRWGGRITFLGGISTTIGTMTEAEIGAHVAEVVGIGRVGGRFFPRTESGIPPMDPEKAKYYIGELKRETKKGYLPGK